MNKTMTLTTDEVAVACAEHIKLRLGYPAGTVLCVTVVYPAGLAAEDTWDLTFEPKETNTESLPDRSRGE